MKKLMEYGGKIKEYLLRLKPKRWFTLTNVIIFIGFLTAIIYVFPI